MDSHIKDSAHALEAASVMRLLPHPRPRLLALGEPTHQEELLLEVRNTLFEQLVEQEGYRSISLESDCLMGLLVDDYVTSGKGALDDVMERGFSHEWGRLAGNRELVRWMRAYNDGRPAADQVRFAAFDGPLEIGHAASPRQVLTALHDYLAARLDATLLPCTARTLDDLIGADDRWTDPAAAMDPAKSIGRSAEAKELRLLADDLAMLIDTQRPRLIAASSPDEWDRARLYARTATGLLRYHSWMTDDSPIRWARLSAIRDAMMAANLLAVAERRPGLVHASNLHLKRELSVMRMNDIPVEWWSAGAIVDTRLGHEYAFVPTALGTIQHRGVDVPPADTLEGLLYALPGDRHVIDARGLAAALGDERPTPRESAYFGYFPFDPTHLPAADGLVWIKDLPAPSSA